MSNSANEKASQTYPVDWDNVHSKCPCCHNQIKVEFNWQPDSANLTLTPVNKPIPQETQIQHVTSGTNSSLMNIVSIERVDNGQLSLKNLPQFTKPPNEGPRHEEDDSIGGNESTSSSMSSNSMTQNSGQNGSLAQTTIDTIISQGVASDPNYILKSDQELTQLTSNQQLSQGLKLKCQFRGCDEIVEGPQQLELHYKLHKGEKIQKCDWYQCNRLFSSKEKLRNHIRCKHTGERPYKCNQCDKAFTSGKHLRDHSVLHTDIRPFACEWAGCNVKFRRRHHLVAHQRVHTKERPFACQYPGCEVRFTKTHHVKRHYDTHFKNAAYKMYQAEVCRNQLPETLNLKQSSLTAITAATTSSVPSYIFLQQ